MTRPEIREFRDGDLDQVVAMALLAFGDEGETIARLVQGLASEEAQPPIRSYVAVVEEEAAGFVSFSPVFDKATDLSSAYLLAPLVVHPEHQGSGIGRGLVEYGIDALRVQGIEVLLVYGDPDYYGRFGFNHEVANNFIPPYELTMKEGWLGLGLNKSAAPSTTIEFSCCSSMQNPDLW